MFHDRSETVRWLWFLWCEDLTCDWLQYNKHSRHILGVQANIITAVSQECLIGILVVSKVFGPFSSHPNLLATMMSRLSKNRGHGEAVPYTEILRRPSLIMMVIYLGKKKKKQKMLKTPNTLYELDWQLSSRARGGQERKCRATVVLEMESSLLNTGTNSPER